LKHKICNGLGVGLAYFRERALAASLKPIRRGHPGRPVPDFRERALAASLKH